MLTGKYTVSGQKAMAPRSLSIALNKGSSIATKVVMMMKAERKTNFDIVKLNVDPVSLGSNLKV